MWPYVIGAAAVIAVELAAALLLVTVLTIRATADGRRECHPEPVEGPPWEQGE